MLTITFLNPSPPAVTLDRSGWQTARKCGRSCLVSVPELPADYQSQTHASDKPLHKYLEYCRADQGIQQAQHGIVHIPKATDTDLTKEEDYRRDEEGEHRCCPYGNDLVPQRICELRIHNFAILKSDWEGSTRCWISIIDLPSISKLSTTKNLAILTPKPTAPKAAMVNMSNHIPLNHCPKVGREFRESWP